MGLAVRQWSDAGDKGSGGWGVSDFYTCSVTRRTRCILVCLSRATPSFSTLCAERSLATLITFPLVGFRGAGQPVQQLVEAGKKVSRLPELLRMTTQATATCHLFCERRMTRACDRSKVSRTALAVYILPPVERSLGKSGCARVRSLRSLGGSGLAWAVVIGGCELCFAVRNGIGAINGRPGWFHATVTSVLSSAQVRCFLRSFSHLLLTTTCVRYLVDRWRPVVLAPCRRLVGCF